MNKKQMELPRKFKGIWIPREIWLEGGLSLLEKAMLAEIDSLDSDGSGCTASNSYFSRFFGLDERHIRRVIAKLQRENLVSSKVEKSQANRRYLSVISAAGTTGENVRSTTGQNVLSDDKNTTDILTPTLRTFSPPPLRTSMSGVSGGIRKENKPNPKGLGRANQRTKEKPVDSLAQQPLGLGLEIKKKRTLFAMELSDLFRLNDNEATTFARVADHLEHCVELGRFTPAIFDTAIVWAKEAKGSRAASQKALFVAKVKQETGFKGRGRMVRAAV